VLVARCKGQAQHAIRKRDERRVLGEQARGTAQAAAAYQLQPVFASLRSTADNWSKKREKLIEHAAALVGAQL
jgi:hypothetical protein